MKKVIKIPLMTRPGTPNVNNGYIYSKECIDIAINNKRIKELIKMRKLYLYDERTGKYFCSKHLLPIENIIAPIINIREDSIDIEVDNNYNESRFEDCKAGMIYTCTHNKAKNITNMMIMGYEIINIPTFNKSLEERNKNGR